MHEFWDRIEDYQFRETDNERKSSDKTWGSWSAMEYKCEDEFVNVVLPRDASDKRELFVITFDYKKNGYTPLSDEADILNEKKMLMDKIMSVSNYSAYVVDYDYGKVFPIIDSSDSDEAVVIGYDALLRYERFVTLSEHYREHGFPQYKGDEETIKKMTDLLRGISDFYKKDLPYGHIEPNDICVDSDGNYRLCVPFKEWFTRSLADDRKKNHNYCAPEMIKESDRPFNMQSDLYSLGIIFYAELNNGKTPFEESCNSLEDAIQKRNSGDEEIPCPANGSKMLHYIIRKACAVNLDVRYSTAEEMLDDLKKIGGVIDQSDQMNDPMSICTLKELPVVDVETEMEEIPPIEPIIINDKKPDKPVKNNDLAITKKTGENKNKPQFQPNKPNNNTATQHINNFSPNRVPNNPPNRVPNNPPNNNNNFNNQNQRPTNNNREQYIQTDFSRQNTPKKSILPSIAAVFVIITCAVVGGALFLDPRSDSNDDYIKSDSSSSSSESNVSDDTVSEDKATEKEQETLPPTEAPTDPPTEAPTDPPTEALTDPPTKAPETKAPEKKTVVIDNLGNNDKTEAVDHGSSSNGSQHVYEFVSGKYTWEQAKKYCESSGGQLATIHSNEDWNQIINCVENARNRNSSLQYVWLGAKTKTSTIIDGTSSTISVELEWVDNSETNYVMGDSFTHWYYNGKLGTSEPSAIDMYEYVNKGNIVEEPYLMLWYVSPYTGSASEKEWSLNDICDVTNYSNYKDSNMGFVIEKTVLGNTGQVVTKKDDLNIRKSPDENAEIIGKAPKGSTVKIVDKVGNWYEIEYFDGYGYVSADYISLN